MEIVDLHCDLLSYLAKDPARTPNDPLSRASLPQMEQGGVRLQTLAIFTKTDSHSVLQGHAQVEWFLKLRSNTTRFLAAFENASAFADEKEPLDLALKRLEGYQKQLGQILYISLTWDGENRFGGGVGATCGLKEDGKRLLEWMDGKQIALDFSHTSDRLAEDALNFLETKRCQIPVLASHSNFREVTEMARNLPREIAQEILRRGGLIGLNLFGPFIHKSDPTAILHHVEYGLALGGENTLCFGADFFCDADAPQLKEKYPGQPLFFPEWSDASIYPRLTTLLQRRLSLTDGQIHKLASENALNFLNSMKQTV
ncbi:MAG: membrane dipeptidase [Verrucomicrobia bacterium]|nr:membrane dipeptidase [Verrucomicrobiota bacterium]